MKHQKNARCYCCNKKATTNEHTPPKCFFPQKKHLPKNSPNYRKNLITVPSCSEHNNHRSKDDEYTAAVIIMNSESKLAFTFHKSKWVKTMLRNQASLGKRIFSQARKVQTISKKDNLFIPVERVAIRYEIDRIENVIKSIARAIYYLESKFQDQWLDDILIGSLNFLNKDFTQTQYLHDLRKINQKFIALQETEEYRIPKKGSNPEIFYYQFLKEENNNCLIRLVFYDDFIFIVKLTKSISIFV